MPLQEVLWFPAACGPIDRSARSAAVPNALRSVGLSCAGEAHRAILQNKWGRSNFAAMGDFVWRANREEISFPSQSGDSSGHFLATRYLVRYLIQPVEYRLALSVQQAVGCLPVGQ